MNIAKRIGIAIVATITAAFLAAAAGTVSSTQAGPGGCCPARQVSSADR